MTDNEVIIKGRCKLTKKGKKICMYLRYLRLRCRVSVFGTYLTDIRWGGTSPTWLGNDNLDVGALRVPKE